MSLAEIRKEFPILQSKIYLNTCSLGAFSRRHRTYMNRFMDLWDELGASAWYEHWLGAADSVRSMAAGVMGADEEEIALGHSVSTVMSTLASCYTFRGGQNVVVTDLDFPTANYQWLAKKGLPLHTKIVRSPDGVHVPAGDIAGAIDEQTVIVSTSHVFFGSGYIQDIGAIGRYARGRGAHTMIDAYQSVGQVPVDVHALEIDMLITGGLKWLLGGPGITYLYVRKGLIESMKPANAGWFGVRDQFGFDQMKFEFLDSARRFETGTPAAAAAFAAKAGLELILETGLETIQETTKELTEELVHELKKAGFQLRAAARKEERSAIVMIAHPDPAPVVKELARRGIIVDHRKDNIRVSPYFYNTSEDLSTFVSALKELV
ncbi:aminotransferase class V-fold PLP-dependent enzyme [candidate division KSB1 bacterium]